MQEESLIIGKKFSIQNFVQRLFTTFCRFPVVLCIATFGSIMALFYINCISSCGTKSFIAPLLTSIIGFPWMLALTLFLEQYVKKITLRIVVEIASLSLLVLYYFILRENYSFWPTILNFVVGNFIGYSLVIASLALPHYKNVSEFWDRVYSLVLRIFFTGILTGVAFFGFTALWTSLKYLFNSYYIDSTYGQLIGSTWVILVGIVGVWYLLADFPEKNKEYKKKFPKIFVYLIQYVLLPLLSIYAAVLYVYAAKILFTRIWPLEGVTRLIIGYSLVGFITFFFAYPLWSKEENKKIKSIFSVWFISLFPLLVLYFVAIGIRIKNYGVTDARYYIILFGVWFTSLAGYFLFSRKKHIVLFLISALPLALFSLWGPWSAKNISLRSQINRLEKKLTEQKILVEGKFQKNNSEIASNDVVQIYSKVEYIAKYNALDRLQSWFDEPISKIIFTEYQDDYVDSPANKLLRYMGISNRGYANNSYSFSTRYLNQGNQALAIDNYDYLVSIDMFKFSSSVNNNFTIQSFGNGTTTTQKLNFFLDKTDLKVTLPSKEVITISFAKRIEDVIKKFGSRYDVPMEELVMSGEEKGIKFKVYPQDIFLEKVTDGYNISEFRAQVLIKFSK